MKAIEKKRNIARAEQSVFTFDKVFPPINFFFSVEN